MDAETFAKCASSLELFSAWDERHMAQCLGFVGGAECTTVKEGAALDLQDKTFLNGMGHRNSSLDFLVSKIVGSQNHNWK